MHAAVRYTSVVRETIVLVEERVEPGNDGPSNYITWNSANFPVNWAPLYTPATADRAV